MRNRHLDGRCGAMVYLPIRCRVRACRRCSKERIRRELDRYKAQIAKFAKPALLTFTIGRVKDPEGFRKLVELINKSFERLRRNKAWPKCPGIVAFETTWTKEKGFHPHLHVIADFPWLADLHQIVETWQRLTGAKHHVDIKRAVTKEEREGLAHEGMKYVTKAWELDKGALRTLLAVVGRRKLIRAFGGLRAEIEDTGGEDEEGACCPGCKTPLGQCAFNFKRTTMTEREAAADVAFLRAGGHKVYSDWYYPGREDRPAPPPGGPDPRPGLMGFT